MAVLSLEELCINAIAKNFDVYNSIYLFCKDDPFVRNIELLRKIYSGVILPLLIERNELKDSHGEFIINKYIKELRLGTLKDISWETIVNRIVEIGLGLETFVFGGFMESQLNASADIIFPHLENLTVLHIENDCNDDILFLISKYCAKLVELNINESRKVTGSGLSYLANNVVDSSLKVIHIDKTNIIIDDAAYLLQNIPSLEIIKYQHILMSLYIMHKDDLEQHTLSEVRPYNLTEIYYDYDDSILPLSLHSELLKICSALCPRLKMFRFYIINNEHLDFCNSFSDAETVSLKGVLNAELIDADRYFQSQKCNITHLNLSQFKLSVSVLAESCPQLKVLELENIDFQELDKNTVYSFKNLVNLVFRQHNFNNVIYSDCLKSMLLCCPVLEEVNFDNCELYRVHFDKTFLSKLSFRSLKLVKSSLKMSLLQSIVFALPSLDSLTVEECVGMNTEEDSLLYDIFGNTTYRPFVHFFVDGDPEIENL